MKRLFDHIVKLWVWIAAILTVTLLVLFAFMLGVRSTASIQRFSWKFLISSVWDPVHNVFGALPFLYGTALTSLIAIVLGGIIGLGSAIFLAYFVEGRMKSWIGGAIELLAAIPSVVYGLWGLFVLVPWLQLVGEPWLSKWLGFLPIFRGMPLGVGYLAAGIVLTIMILPTVTALSRDVLSGVPKDLEEGAYALGMTRYETIRRVMLPFARSGVIGALMLGLGRAFGETIAVTMVIGNRPQIAGSLFSPGYTMASVIANEFTEATTSTYLSSLYEIGFVLLVVTVFFYFFAHLLVRRPGRLGRARAQ